MSSPPNVSMPSVPEAPFNMSAWEPPDHFVEGVPYRWASVSCDANGEPIRIAIKLEPPSHMPSAYWREGC